MSLCRNVFRVVEAVLQKDDHGCTFTDVLETTPSDMNGSDVLKATVAAVKGDLLIERGDRIFVAKKSPDHEKESGLDVKVKKEVAVDTVGTGHCNTFTMDNGMSPEHSRGSREDNQEILPYIAIPDNDEQAKIRWLYLKDSPLLAGNLDPKSSENSGWQASDNRQFRMAGKKMPGGASSEVAPPAKQTKLTPIKIENQRLPLYKSATSMAVKTANEDTSNRFGANSSLSAPSEPAHCQQDDLDAVQRELSHLNLEILRYGQTMLKQMSPELIKNPNENKPSTENITADSGLALPSRATNEAVPSDSPALGKTNFENKMDVNDKMAAGRKAHNLSTTKVRYEHFHPRYQFLKHLHLSQREFCKFDREGVRAGQGSKSGAYEANDANDAKWFGECEGNVGNFYKDMSHVAEDDLHVEYWTTVCGADDNCGDIEGISYYDFYS